MDSLKKLGNTLFNFVMDNYQNPFLWITIFCVMLALALIAIKEFGEK